MVSLPNIIIFDFGVELLGNKLIPPSHPHVGCCSLGK